MGAFVLRAQDVFEPTGIVPRILEKQGPFDHRGSKRKNLTHLQSILLFKDSSVVLW